MALFEYQCLDCSARDKRIAGFDDLVAVCHECGGLMMRLDDPFLPLENDAKEVTNDQG